MRVGIIVDATCDLPTSVIERHHVEILPLRLSQKTSEFLDQRSPEDALSFYRDTSQSALNGFQLNPLTTEQFKRPLLEHWLYHFDQIMFLAPHLSQHETLSTIRQIIVEEQPQFERLRQAASLTAPFRVRVLESQSAYAGYGLALYELLRLVGEKARTVDQLKAPMEIFKGSIETYICPGTWPSDYVQDIAPRKSTWWKPALLKGKSPRTVLRLAENEFNRVADVSEQRYESDFLLFLYDELTRTHLANHLINISYAGNLAKLRVLEPFKVLMEHVKDKGGRLVLSVMSPYSSRQLGKGALTAAFSREV